MTLSEYFEQNRYKPKYFIGDRIKGNWNKIPFVGTVCNDMFLNEEEGPKIIVCSDLPIKYKNTYYYYLTVKHKDISKLK